MVASQMAPALFDSTTVDIEAEYPDVKPNYLVRSSASVISFPGFTTIYTEGKDEADEKETSPLPHLEKGDEALAVLIEDREASAGSTGKVAGGSVVSAGGCWVISAGGCWVVEASAASSVS